MGLQNIHLTTSLNKYESFIENYSLAANTLRLNSVYTCVHLNSSGLNAVGLMKRDEAELLNLFLNFFPKHFQPEFKIYSKKKTRCRIYVFEK